MTSLTKPRILAYAAIVFAAGLLAGLAGGYALGHRKHMGPPDPDKMVARMQSELQRELSLSPEQVQQIQPSLLKLRDRMRDAHAAAFTQFSGVIHEFNKDISPFLNADQRARLDERTRAGEARFRPPHSDLPKKP